MGCRVVCFRNSAARSCALSLLLDIARVLCSPTSSRILHGLLYVCQIQSKAHITDRNCFALVGFLGEELPPRVNITFQGRSIALGDLVVCTCSVDMKLCVFLSEHAFPGKWLINSRVNWLSLWHPDLCGWRYIIAPSLCDAPILRCVYVRVCMCVCVLSMGCSNT